MPAKKSYENNPFFIAAKGFSLLFDLARGMAILLTVLSLVDFFWGGPDYNPKDGNLLIRTVSAWSPIDWLFIVGGVSIITLAFILVMALLGGMSSYTSARIARGKKVAMSEAYHAAFDRLWSYVWLQAIIAVKLFLWTLLFIVPGIIMAFRYSLSGVAFFDKNLRGNAAIKKSLQLTKGGWVTTFGANLLFNIVTLNALNIVVTTAVNATLYRQFSETKKKPDAHWLSWITLGILAGVALLLLVGGIYALALRLGIIIST